MIAGDRLTRPDCDSRALAAGARVSHYYGAAELSFVAWAITRRGPAALPRGRGGESRRRAVGPLGLHLRGLRRGGPRASARRRRLDDRRRPRRRRADGRVPRRSSGGDASHGRRDRPRRRHRARAAPPRQRATSRSSGSRTPTSGRCGRGVVTDARCRDLGPSPGRAVGSGSAQRPRRWLHLRRPAPHRRREGRHGRPVVERCQGRGRTHDVPTHAPVIIAAARTPIGTAGHSLADLTVDGSRRPVLTSLLARVGATGRRRRRGPGQLHGSRRKRRPGRCTGGRAAGAVPGLTVDRQCGSGLAAVVLAAQLVRDGARHRAGGRVESACTAPWRFWPPGRRGEPLRYERAPFAPARRDPDMGPADDLLATEVGIDREPQDAYAARSHALAVAAAGRGAFRRRDRPGRGHRRGTNDPARPAAHGSHGCARGLRCGRHGDRRQLVRGQRRGRRRGRAQRAGAAPSGPSGLRVLASATAGVAPSRPGRAPSRRVRLALTGPGRPWTRSPPSSSTRRFAGQVLACCDALGARP